MAEGDFAGGYSLGVEMERMRRAFDSHQHQEPVIDMTPFLAMQEEMRASLIEMRALVASAKGTIESAAETVAESLESTISETVETVAETVEIASETVEETTEEIAELPKQLEPDDEKPPKRDGFMNRKLLG